MSLEVLGGTTEGNELAELLRRAVDDAATIPPNEYGEHRFLILTPARLRPRMWNASRWTGCSTAIIRNCTRAW